MVFLESTQPNDFNPVTAGCLAQWPSPFRPLISSFSRDQFPTSISTTSGLAQWWGHQKFTGVFQMLLLLSSALEYSLNEKVLTQDIFCLNIKFNPQFQHAVAKDSIGSFISVHAFTNSSRGMLGKSSLATWFTWKAWLLASFCPLYGISSLWTVIKAVSGHEMFLVTPFTCFE